MKGNVTAISMGGKTPEQILSDRDLNFAIKGLFIAVFAAILWGIYGTMMNSALGLAPFNSSAYGLFAIPAAAGFIEEVTSSIFLFFINFKKGKTREYVRGIKTKSGKLICLGGIIGGPVALTGSMAAILMCGPGYALCITAMYPVFGAICSAIFLKEKTNARLWLGLALCVGGGVVLSFVPPEGADSKVFYIGVIFAVITCMGWGAEGVISGYGTDTIDSDIGSGLRMMASAAGYMVMLPFVGGVKVLFTAITTNPQAIFAVAGVAILAALSVIYWYKAFGMTGVSRAMACNSTYGLWGIIFSGILGALGIIPFALTTNLVIGGLISVIGIILVVANPKELLQLREN